MQTNDTTRGAARAAWLATASLALLVVGCAGPNRLARTAPQIPFAEVADGQPEARRLAEPPYVLHVQAGQVIPVDLVVDSPLFSLEDAPTRLVAERDFYVLVRTDGPPLLSEDGVEFEARPLNAFRVGLRAERDQPTRIQLGVTVHGASAASR